MPRTLLLAGAGALLATWLDSQRATVNWSDTDGECYMQIASHGAGEPA
jgi:hypothetical protein